MFSIRRVVGASALVAAIVIPPGAQVDALTTCSQPLTEVTAPSPGPDHNYLNAVDAPKDAVAFAVGLTQKTIGGLTAPLVERWNGTTWKKQTTPEPWSGAADLYGVYAPTGKDAWAVGYKDATPGAHDRPLAMHWNGNGWKVRSVPTPTTNDAGFGGVSGLGSAPVFAVGYAHRSGVNRTLIERWNGTKWKIMKSPNVGSHLNYLAGVDAISAKNVWAVGDHATTGPDKSLILHWNGTAWKVVKSPNRGSGGNILNGVVALGPNNVWAVGSYETSPGLFNPLFERWNGSAWKIVKGPALADSAFLYGVDAVSANNLWAVGGDNDSNASIVERWTGAKWKVVSLPSVVASSGLYATAARGTGQVWAVGEQASYTQTLVFGRCT
jgi:hypothetical protein